MDAVRVCHTELSKSEREKQIQYANTYIWNLRENKGHEEPSGKMGIKTETYLRMDLRIWGGGGVRCDRVREWHRHIYTTKCKTDS